MIFYFSVLSVLSQSLPGSSVSAAGDVVSSTLFYSFSDFIYSYHTPNKSMNGSPKISLRVFKFVTISLLSVFLTNEFFRGNTR